MRFGISSGPQNIDFPELRRRWLLADGLGYSSGWLLDHLLPITGNLDDRIFEPWSSLASLGAVTERIELGTLVTCNTFRHPALLAKMATTIDHATGGGRVVVGIGTGYFEPEHDQLGIPLPPLRERGEMLAESVQVMKGLWSPGRFSFAGRHYQIDDAPMEPLPLQGPIRILIGGAGEQRTLRTVARYADLWNLPPGAEGVTPESFRTKYEVLLRRCEEVGRDPAEIETVVALSVLVNDDGDRALARRREMAGAAGMSDEVAERQIVAGDPAAIAERLQEFEAAGVQHFVVGAGHRFLEDDLELIAEQVMPQLAVTV